MNPPKITSYDHIEKKSSSNTSRKNLTQSSSFNHHHYQINCKSQIKKRFSDLVIIKSLWNDLGVNIDFQKEFEQYYNELKDFQEKRELLNNEKNHLRKFRESLIKLSEEISNRDNVIFKLNKYCNELDKYTYHKNIYSNSNLNINIGNENEDEIPFNLFNLIQNTIKLYRINTANVINRIIKVREISSYYELNKKWDPSIINRSYSLDKNYILKMVNDIDFLNNSSITNYILTNNRNELPKIDLFLSNWIYIILPNNKKLKLSISFELQNEINKCKYIILQDKLLNKVKKERNSRKLSKKHGRIFSPKSHQVHSIGSNLNCVTKKSHSEIFLRNDKDEKKFFELFGHNKINLSRTLYYLKKTMGQKYEKIFYSENNGNNEQKNLNIMNQIFALNNKKDFYETNNDNNNDKNINIVDNNRGIMEYCNKKGWNKMNIFSSESNSNNIITEQLNKNYEDIKTTKNVDNLYLKQQNNIKKRNQSKKKHKRDKSKSKEKTMSKDKSKSKEKSKSKDKIEKTTKKEEEKNNNTNNTNTNPIIINKEEKENIIITKEETKEKENEIKTVDNINKKPVILIKKFDFENIKVDNIMNINIITTTNKEKELNENIETISDKNFNNNTLFENDIKLDNKKEDNLEEENNNKDNNKDELNQEINNEIVNYKILDEEKKEEKKEEEKEEIKEEKKEEIKEEEKEITEEEKKEEEIKDEKNLEELDEKESKNYITISNNHSRISEDNHISKNKLLRYRQYTEEEIKKVNKEYDKFY